MTGQSQICSDGRGAFQGRRYWSDEADEHEADLDFPDSGENEVHTAGFSAGEKAATMPSMPPSSMRSKARRLTVLAVGQALHRQSVLARSLCGVKLPSVLARSVREALAGVVKDLPVMVSSFLPFWRGQLFWRGKKQSERDHSQCKCSYCGCSAK